MNGPLLAQFLLQVEQEEKIALQHQRDYEEQTLRLTSLQPQPAGGKRPEQPVEIVIDFAHIPTFEEYR